MGGAPARSAEILVDDDAGCSTASSCGQGGNPPCCKIQDGICNAGGAIDTVRVMPGTYNESLRLRPGVSVISDQGPSVTTIDGTGQNCADNDWCGTKALSPCSVVIINSSVGSDTRLEGFTITGGSGVTVAFGPIDKRMGGGIVSFGSPIITNNVISGNSLSGGENYYYGGGIATSGSAIGRPQITNNTIRGNDALPPSGQGNLTSYAYGGGIYSGYLSAPTIENNIIENNEAGNRSIPDETAGSGGGIFLFNKGDTETTIITRNLIAGNKARDNGGGIKADSYPCDPPTCPHTTAVITNNEIRFNDGGEAIGAGEGGGIATYNVSATIANNTIHGNSAEIGGGHWKGPQGGGDVVEDANNIYSSNAARTASTGGGIHALVSCHPIRNSDFWQNTPSNLDGSCSSSVIGTAGNIQQDPLYIDGDNSDGTVDLHLDESSLLIDVANDPDAPLVDREQLPRPLDGDRDGTATSDMGAYEVALDCEADGTADYLDPDDDNDGDPDTTDCATCDASRFNGATEVCNGIDDDCSGIVDDDADTDSDGTFDCLDDDDDNDGFLDGVDCAPLVNSVHSAPGEVGPTLRFDTLSDFHWERIPQANVYNVYRGTIAPSGFVYNHVCFETESPDQASSDPAAPAAGQASYYLVSGVNICDEGTLGFDSISIERPNGSPCGSLSNDTDNDTVIDINDNCPLTSNADQKDLDLDTVGDLCDDDDDNDGVDDLNDCAPADAGAFAVPTVVSGVTVSGVVPTDVSWTTQNVGSQTTYDIATGLISDASINQYLPGTCQENDDASPPSTDSRPDPSPNDGYYYLVRSQNVCGTSSYGTAQRDLHGDGSGCP